MQLKKAPFFLLFTIIAFSSCNKAEIPVCDGGTPTYDDDIKLIIDNNCVSCHSAGANKGDYTTYSTFSTHRSNGKFESSVLIKQDMPESSSSKLSQSELNLIKCWVENGFPEN